MIKELLKQRIERDYSADEYPALRYQMELWRESKPLGGLRLLDASPIFFNTLPKYLALIEGGAELSAGIADPALCDPKAVEFIVAAGIPVFGKDEKIPGFDIILDCAAAYANCDANIGYVELTRSGVERYTKCGKTAYVADSGRIKRIETSLGTGESYFRAMAHLGYNDWKGRKVLIFGTGKVGSGIAMYARRMGAEVITVSDPATISGRTGEYIDKAVDFRDSTAVAEAVAEADYIVTATGVAGAVTAVCPAEIVITSKAVLANMGVEDEFGETIPAERVLNAKSPVNFILAEPTHLRYIDATMALHNAGALYLATHPDVQGLIIPDAATEEELLGVSISHGRAGEEIRSII